MSESGEATPEKPTFDFSNVTRKWLRELSRLTRETSELQAAVQEDEPTDVDAEVVADWRDARMEAAVEIEAHDGQDRRDDGGCSDFGAPILVSA